jgi:hypothetical protein
VELFLLSPFGLGHSSVSQRYALRSGLKETAVPEDAVFRFLQGEKLMFAIGLGDTEPCEVIEDSGGGEVLLRHQIYESGSFHEKWVDRKRLVWLRGSATSDRYNEWKKTCESGASGDRSPQGGDRETGRHAEHESAVGEAETPTTEGDS